MGVIYLDNAATNRYVPQAAMSAYVRAVNRKANPGRAAHRDAAWLGLEVYRVRQQILSFVGAQHAEVVFTKNCTEALNLGILGFLREGHVVTTCTEHNSVLRPLYALERENKVRLSVVQPKRPEVGVGVEEVAAALRPDTRLVVVNHASNVTGIANDVAAIGAYLSERSVPFMVDGAQSAGHLPLHMGRMGIDMLAMPAHKGLHGLYGVGCLVLNRRLRLSPLTYGGTGTHSETLLPPVEYPESMEAGTLDAPAILAFGKALSWTEAHLGELWEREEKLIERAKRGLGEIEGVRLYGGGCGILSFSLSNLDSTAVADRLDERGIAVRAGLHCAPLMHRYLATQKKGLVRISVGYVNTPSHIDRLVEEVKRLAQGSSLRE